MSLQSVLRVLALAVGLSAARSGVASDTTTTELYRAKCGQCHMADGNSPVEPLSFADGKWTHGSKVEEVERVIADGVPGSAMLAFKSQLTPEQIAALADYVRAFDKGLKAAKRKK